MGKKKYPKPKNQHWVPKFYLRQFATPETCRTNEPKVWIFSKDEKDGNESITNIKNICAKRYLYSAVGNEGDRCWNLENKFSELESHMSKIWNLLASDYVDLSDSSLRKGIALFVALMYLRHPSQLDKAKKIHKQIVRLFDQHPRKTDGSPDIEFVKINGKEFDMDTSDWYEYKAWNKNDHHKVFVQLVQQESTNLADLLMDKRWSIVFTETNQFITSDNPVVKQHQTKETFGFGTDGTVVSFPISQKRILVMDDRIDEPANQYYPLNEGALGAFNYGIWHNGSRFMISGRPIPEILSEIIFWADAGKAL